MPACLRVTVSRVRAEGAPCSCLETAWCSRSAAGTRPLRPPLMPGWLQRGRAPPVCIAQPSPANTHEAGSSDLGRLLANQPAPPGPCIATRWGTVTPWGCRGRGTLSCPSLGQGLQPVPKSTEVRASSVPRLEELYPACFLIAFFPATPFPTLSCLHKSAPELIACLESTIYKAQQSFAASVCSFP